MNEQQHFVRDLLVCLAAGLAVLAFVIAVAFSSVPGGARDEHQDTPSEATCSTTVYLSDGPHVLHYMPTNGAC